MRRSGRRRRRTTTITEATATAMQKNAMLLPMMAVLIMIAAPGFGMCERYTVCRSGLGTGRFDLTLPIWGCLRRLYRFTLFVAIALVSLDTVGVALSVAVLLGQVVAAAGLGAAVGISAHT